MLYHRKDKNVVINKEKILYVIVSYTVSVIIGLKNIEINKNN
jgi:hypothetical protein